VVHVDHRQNTKRHDFLAQRFARLPRLLRIRLQIHSAFGRVLALFQRMQFALCVAQDELHVRFVVGHLADPALHRVDPGLLGSQPPVMA